MSKEQRYKKIAELLLGRLIVLQREFNNIAEVIEESLELLYYHSIWNK